MSTITLTPYEILGVKSLAEDLQLRLAYRERILEFKNKKIQSEKFQLICRAYETLSDYEKREIYDKKKQWISNLSLSKYTLQQLAAEPDLVEELKYRLKNATIREINEQDPITGHTPLYCAARACNVDAVYYLTENGAEPDLKQKRGSSALHVSAFYGHPEMVRCMLESGADYRIKNSYGNLAEDEDLNDHDVKQTFIDMKKEPFIQIAADQIDWFKHNKLLNHIDKQYYRQQQTLLHCASKKGYFNLVQWLIEEYSANLDIIDRNLNSALHLASYGGHMNIVKYLLDHGANSLLINKWGMTAEQEGIIHKNKITNLFQDIRQYDMFEMATNGIDWWFKYHFSNNSPDTMNEKGVSLLYIASRYGQISVVKWLLENGANVNLQITNDSRSTPLHGAVYHGHLSVVELLLSYGADMNIKNQYGETIFENARTDQMKELLRKKRQNFYDNKYLIIHLYGDGKKAGDEPLAKIQLDSYANYNDLIDALPESLRDSYNSFSIARRPLNFDETNTTVLSAICRARYVKTKFIQLPICITAHEKARYIHSGHISHEEIIDYNLREFQGKFNSKCKNSLIQIKGQLDKKQEFHFNNLSFIFPINCTTKDISIEIQYLFSPNLDTFHLQECLCLFRTKYLDNKQQLNEMPIVLFNNDKLNIRLYNWIESSPYWFTYNTRHIRLPFIDGVHAFIHHVDIIPNLLSLPPDMFIQSTIGEPFIIRHTPFYCQCLQIREHNKKDFPHIAYHGTSINVIPSILMDGLVMPSTVVSNGLRVCPPTNHIARGTKAFNIEDFSNGIFLSPSIHYCSDPAYAVSFLDGDQRLLAVLECSVKNNSYKAFPSTVPGYKSHPDDDPNCLEWRFTNPADIQIISILFIPLMKSRIAAVRLRASKLGINPNNVS